MTNLVFEVFLSPFTTERLLATDRDREPNPACPVCSVAQSRVLVDLSRATLGDLVDMLRLDLGYGEEFSVDSEAGLLYDVEETENLGKRFSDLGLSPCTPAKSPANISQVSKMTVSLQSLMKIWRSRVLISF